MKARLYRNGEEKPENLKREMVRERIPGEGSVQTDVEIPE